MENLISEKGKKDSMKKKLMFSMRLILFTFIFLNSIISHAVSNRSFNNNMPCTVDLKQGEPKVKADLTKNFCKMPQSAFMKRSN